MGHVQSMIQRLNKTKDTRNKSLSCCFNNSGRVRSDKEMSLVIILFNNGEVRNVAEDRLRLRGVGNLDLESKLLS